MTDPAPEPVVRDLDALLHLQGGRTYRQLLTVPALSVGLFAAPPGHSDTQQPHEQDEVYVVVAGAAVLDVDGARAAVGPGSVAYVPAGVPHRFRDVTEDLHVVVVFSPPYPDEP